MFRIFWVSNNENQTDDLEVVEEDEFSSQEDIEWQIALDIAENSREIIIVSPIAWVELEDIDISLEENILTISWDRIIPDILNNSKVIIRNSECFWGRFSRNIILPENLDLDSIKAVLEKGILYITISKLKFSSQTIEIESRI